MLLRGWIIMGVSMDEVAIGRLKIYWEKKEKEEVLILRAIDLSMVAAGLTFLFRYTGNIRVFATFGDWKNDEKRRKGRDSKAERHRWTYEAAGLTFLFRYIGNIRVFASFGDWKYGEKRRKGRGSAAGITSCKHRKYEGFCFFIGEGWGRGKGKKRGARGKRRERRGPYENESQKALNFAFLFDCFKCSQEKF